MINNDSKELDYVRIPPVPEHLVDFLDQNFPEQCASLTDSINEIFFKAGQRSVVTFLRTVFLEQKNNV